MSRPAAATSAGRARNARRSVATPPPRRMSGPAAPPRDGGRPPRASIDASALAYADGSLAVADGAAAIAYADRPLARPGRADVDRYGRLPARRRMAFAGPPRLAYGGVAIATRVAGVALDVSGSRMMDRVVRGRVWIGVIGFSLIGLVAMQVSMLKLNSGIGRAAQTVTTLERSNSALRGQITGLSGGDRIQRLAESRGLVMPAPGDVAYLHAGSLGEDAARAARRMRAPSPSTVGFAGGATPAGLQEVAVAPGPGVTPTTVPVTPSDVPAAPAAGVPATGTPPVTAAPTAAPSATMAPAAAPTTAPAVAPTTAPPAGTTAGGATPPTQAP